MKTLTCIGICLVTSSITTFANAVTIVEADPTPTNRYVTPDGSVVVELKPVKSLAASDFNSGAFNGSYGGQFSGYTINQNASTGDTIRVTTYDAATKGADGNGIQYVGGNIDLVYENGGSPTATPHFVQFVSTNKPLNGASSPYTDPSRNDDNLPFYWTESERPGFQSGNNLRFKDFSSRGTEDLFGDPAAETSIDWSADLFYGQWDGATTVEIEGGVQWGWEAKSGTKGAATARFENAAPGSAVTSGEGTSNFTWGTGTPSRLSFAPESFNPKPNEAFSLGKLDFFNGVIGSNTGATSVDLLLDLAFVNASENDLTETVSFSLVNTPNTSDPQASADFVSFSFGGTNKTFNVLEGQSASADLIGIFNATGFAGNGLANVSGKSFDDPFIFPNSSGLSLSILGFGDPSEFGFVTGDPVAAVPLPSGILLLSGALGALMAARRRRH